ncbi:MAG: hypothetical protein JWN79_363 [Gemmatimonadetes bacterium]|jgi:hypothetical protein|nr:hypothetical protein [Gemmatimonadota bacterium]
MTRLHHAIVAALAVSACATAPAPSVPAEQQFEARAGEAVRVSGSPTRITFVSIADSRCPVDVYCITAGDAVVAVQFSGDAGARSDTLRLAAAPRAVRYGSQRLELLDVRPVPRSTDRNRVPTAVVRVTAVP